VTRLAAVSVDLDAIRFYRAIHGLSSPPAGDKEPPDPVMAVAVPRLANWAKGLGIPITWFVVGSELADAAFSELLLGLCRRGDELANHSFDHYYDLTRRHRGVMREQVLLGTQALSRLTGKNKHGFRAPGYTMTDELAAVLSELLVAYDSSVFPCPIYYGAKAVALVGQRLFGRRSHAILDDARVLTAPMRPYRIGERYDRRGTGMVELPIQVTPRFRLPFIGTTLVGSGPIGARLLTSQVVGEPLVNLELHGIDAIDASDGLTELARVQPDLRLRWPRKLQALTSSINCLKAANYRFVTLEEAACAGEWGSTPNDRVER